MKPLPMTLQAFAIQTTVPRMTMSGWDSDTRHKYKFRLMPLRTRKGEQSWRDATQTAVRRMFVPPPPPPPTGVVPGAINYALNWPPLKITFPSIESLFIEGDARD